MTTAGESGTSLAGGGALLNSRMLLGGVLSRVLLRCGADTSATVDGSTAAVLAQQAGHGALSAELQAPA